MITANTHNTAANNTNRISHKQRKAMRQNVYTNTLNFIINAGNTVHVNKLYTLLGNGVFSSEQYFVRCFIDAAKKDGRIQLHTAKKRGTFAAVNGVEIVIPEKPKAAKKTGIRGRKPKNRKIVMGGYFGISKFTMTGKAVSIEIDEEIWKLCKKVSKSFDSGDTDKVYIMNIKGQPTEYLEVTSKGRQFHYTVDA